MDQIIAGVLLAVFYGCFFVKMLLQRKKGIQTFQMGQSKKGFVKAIELTLKFASFAVPLAEIVSICLRTGSLPLPVRTMGAAMAVLGDTVFVISVVTMRDNWRAGVSETDKTELVTNGIYSLSRNPAFLGFDLVYLGILLMFFNWVLFAVSAFAALMFHLQIVNVEEDFLTAAFGDDYLQYKKRVHRYFGRTGKR